MLNSTNCQLQRSEWSFVFVGSFGCLDQLEVSYCPSYIINQNRKDTKSFLNLKSNVPFLVLLKFVQLHVTIPNASCYMQFSRQPQALQIAVDKAHAVILLLTIRK